MRRHHWLADGEVRALVSLVAGARQNAAALTFRLGRRSRVRSTCGVVGCGDPGMKYDEGRSIERPSFVAISPGDSAPTSGFYCLTTLYTALPSKLLLGGLIGRVSR